MALTKVGKEGVTGISNSSNATAITINSSENVGIGKSTSIADRVHIEKSGANCLLSVARTSDGAAGRLVMQHTDTVGALQTTGSVPLTFGTADTERMRIDASGHVGIGTTTLTGSGTPDETDNATGIRLLSSGFIGIGRDAGICGQFNRNNAGAILGFRRAGTEVGTISVSNTATAYNTSSDYRLKTAVNYDWDSTTRLKQLKPARFEWISDGDSAVPVDGFLAHEAAIVCPESVTGTKDAVEVWKEDEELPDGVSVGDNKLDDDGNTIPVYQGIDQSKLVPLLVKSLQEAITKIETLETKVQALEDA